MCKVIVISAQLLEHSRHLGIGSNFLFVVNLFVSDYWGAIMNERLQEDIVGGHKEKQNKISVFEEACHS